MSESLTTIPSPDLDSTGPVSNATQAVIGVIDVPAPNADTGGSGTRGTREPPVLTLPDYKGAPASHWLTQWEHLHGLQRVAQHDWQRPLRGDWMMQLQEAVLRHDRVHLLAHGLGAHLIDAWLRHTQQTRRVASVLLVDPIDMQDPACQEVLFSWRPLAAQPWPWPVAVLWKERQATPALADVLSTWGAQPLAEAPVGAGVVGGWSLVNEYLLRMQAMACSEVEA